MAVEGYHDCVKRPTELEYVRLIDLAKWAKKDTKYLMELIGLEEEGDIWL